MASVREGINRYMRGAHIPVLLQQAVDGLDITPGKRIIDATMGGAGHSIEIIRKGAELLGIDQDKKALEIAEQSIKTRLNTNIDVRRNYTLIQGNFRDIERIARDNKFGEVDGILFDLGMSSIQLDDRKRGFSYRFLDAPLDMRMDEKQSETAQLYLQLVSREELYDTLSRYGEEQLAGTLADHFILARKLSKLQTVGDVVRVVSEVVKDEIQKMGVLSRVFQALRIRINDEMESLKQGLIGAQTLLKSGGRLVVISFHSLEDRTAKLFMRNGNWELITKHPITAGYDEQRENSRSRSAKLRIAQKI